MNTHKVEMYCRPLLVKSPDKARGTAEARLTKTLCIISPETFRFTENSGEVQKPYGKEIKFRLKNGSRLDGMSDRGWFIKVDSIKPIA